MIRKTGKRSLVLTSKSVFERNPKKTFIAMIIILLLLLEGLLRLFFPAHLINKKLIIPDVRTFKSYVPNQTFTIYPSKYDSFVPVENIINSLGIRGSELAKKENYRVLNIGDSFIEAQQAQYEDTFGYLLNNSFADIEFISHGISSWSVTPEFSWVYHNREIVDFDEVNLFLCINDFYRNSVYDGGDQFYRKQVEFVKGIPKKYNVLKINNSSFKSLLKKIYLIKVALFTRSIMASKSSVNNTSLVPEEMIMLNENFTLWDRSLKDSVKETMDVIGNLKKYLDSHNIKLNILMVPLGIGWKDETVQGKQLPPYNWDKSFTLEQRGLENYLIKYLNTNNINYINLREEFNSFKSQNPNTLLFHEVDGHWNKNGHKVVFTKLEKYFSERNNKVQ